MDDVIENEFDVEAVEITDFEPEKKDKIEFDKICAILVVVLLAISAIAAAAHPIKETSEKENRDLAGFPDLSLETIMSGSFMKDFETFAADQFRFRDGAVSLKAQSERMMGKKENNSVLFADNGYLVPHPIEYNKETVEKNLESLRIMQEKGGFDVTLAIIPMAFEVLKDKLPAFSYDSRVADVINEAKVYLDQSPIKVADTTKILSEHKDEYIYYRTDHHQTALGSYYVYKALGVPLMYEPHALDDYTVERLTDDFYGTAWSKASLVFQKPDEMDFYSIEGSPTANVEFPLEGKKLIGLLSKNNLGKKDKYSVYLDGNHGLTVINTNRVNDGKKRSLAVIKDSYAHSFVPFLTDHYDTIHLIDMRYYNDDIYMYLGENKIKDILVMYESDTFVSDTNISKIGDMAATTAFVPMPPYGVIEQQPQAVDDSYFTDAVFYGDSITYAHCSFATVPARFISRSGMTTYTMDSEVYAQTGEPMIDALLNAEGVNKYYIMLGLNEIAIESLETYEANYRELIRKIKEKNPEAIIYIESLTPVCASADNSDGRWLGQIRAANECLKKIAVDTECYYLDIFSALESGNGYLPEGAASDGIHFNGDYHMMWEEYTKTHAAGAAAANADTQAFTLYSGGGSCDTEAFATAMLNGVPFKDTMNIIRDNVCARQFNIEQGEALCGIAYMSGGSTAEEFAMFEAADESAAAVLAEKIRNHIDGRKRDFESYKPDELSKLNDPVIEVKGSVVMMCVSDYNNEARAVIAGF